MLKSTYESRCGWDQNRPLSSRRVLDHDLPPHRARCDQHDLPPHGTRSIRTYARTCATRREARGGRTSIVGWVEVEGTGTSRERVSTCSKGFEFRRTPLRPRRSHVACGWSAHGTARRNSIGFEQPGIRCRLSEKRPQGHFLVIPKVARMTSHLARSSHGPSFSVGATARSPADLPAQERRHTRRATSWSSRGSIAPLF